MSHDAGLPKSTVFEVLAGKRPFSRLMIRKLAGYFNVDAALLATNLKVPRGVLPFRQANAIR